jgi:hypothetical protein
MSSSEERATALSGFAEGRYVGAHDGDTERHGLERRNSEPLFQGHISKRVGMAQQGGQLDIRNPSRESDAISYAETFRMGSEIITPCVRGTN